MSLLRLRDVSLGYGGRPILTHIGLQIERGEFVALLGGNGSGKTTLLRGIVGLLPLMAGTIEWAFDRATSPLGYVPQRESLDPTFPLTAGEVVVMGTYARLGPLARVGRRQRAAAARALDLVGLGDLAGQRFSSLSGGQMQRVLIARALVAEPVFLVLDEPTAGVDREATAAIMSVVSRLNRDHSLTVVLVTHQLRVLHGLASTVWWVQDGAVTRRRLDDLLAADPLLAGAGE